MYFRYILHEEEKGKKQEAIAVISLVGAKH